MPNFKVFLCPRCASRVAQEQMVQVTFSESLGYPSCGHEKFTTPRPVGNYSDRPDGGSTAESQQERLGNA